MHKTVIYKVGALHPLTCRKPFAFSREDNNGCNRFGLESDLTCCRCTADLGPFPGSTEMDMAHIDQEKDRGGVWNKRLHYNSHFGAT